MGGRSRVLAVVVSCGHEGRSIASMVLYHIYLLAAESAAAYSSRGCCKGRWVKLALSQGTTGT